MKQILTLGLAMMIYIVSFAQKNVTQFLGIPVDGTKSTMIQKLKAKGYTYNAKRDCMDGEFNGRDVHIYIVTNNNKVWRIMVTDVYTTSNETDIRIRFNTLCKQFSKNSKYLPANLTGEYEISEDEDISHQMIVRNKRYEASYWQVADTDKDTTAFQEWALEKIESKYSEEERGNLSETEIQQLMLGLFVDYISEKFAKKSVWFMISRDYGEYSIVMYYDNEYNHSNGEDL